MNARKRRTKARKRLKSPKRGEYVTEAMLPEFEHTPENARRFRAWAALDSLEKGSNEASVQLLYGMTQADLAPYRAEWEGMRPPKPA